MITIEAEQEHYCLARDGEVWTVVERRAGKYYPLGNCSQPGIAIDRPEASMLFPKGRCYSEPAARRILDEVATEWRYLYERLR